LTTTMGPSIKVDAKNLPAEVKEIVGWYICRSFDRLFFAA
jgi:hypothetical protein